MGLSRSEKLVIRVFIIASVRRLDHQRGGHDGVAPDDECAAWALAAILARKLAGRLVASLGVLLSTMLLRAVRLPSQIDAPHA